jgi:putative spermidine/putrescine transport system ATP-binding protein
MAFLELSAIQKSYGQAVAVQRADLAVERGEFVSFLGPSGCGKTTTLRMIAGFETPDTGRIVIDGQDVTAMPPNKRNIGMVFQSYALFPNMTVARNIGFGLKVAGHRQTEIDTRVDEMLALIRMAAFALRFPYQLSGGQQQRVALARALAIQPRVLLLDEPLSALDAKIRVALRQEIREIQRRLGITTVYVTHDQEEAMSLSDRVVVMNEGRVEQIGTPVEVYNRPATRFVASFVGTLSVLDATVLDTSGLVEVDRQPLQLARQLPTPGTHLAIALRPEAFALGAGVNQLRGTVVDVIFLGSLVRVRLRLDQQLVNVDLFNTPEREPPRIGTELTVSFAPEACLVLAEEGGARQEITSSEHETVGSS